MRPQVVIVPAERYLQVVAYLLVEFYVDIRVTDYGVRAWAFSSARPNGLRDNNPDRSG